MKKYIQPMTKTVATVSEQMICESGGEKALGINGSYGGSQLSKERNHSFDADEW